MAGNTFGKLFQITTFGESHGEANGVVIDGCPAGLAVDINYVQQQLDRRRPGQSAITTQRKESDTVKFISGIFEGKTLGSPIAAIIPNEDHRSGDYDALKDVYRPSHADYTYQQKYGIRDHRGGGRSSARETACRVVAGSIAELFLKTEGIEIIAFVSSVGKIDSNFDFDNLSRDLVDLSLVRCPDLEISGLMEQAINEAKTSGDSLGGIITCVVRNCPVGLGEPVFDRLQADLAKAMLSINAVKGFEYGSGFAGTHLKGSEHNDAFVSENGEVRTQTNHSGGIQGGISNGMDIYFRVAFKPTATISKPQDTLDVYGSAFTLAATGRHDPCVVPRAVPIVEAMTALVLADHLLRKRLSRI